MRPHRLLALLAVMSLVMACNLPLLVPAATSTAAPPTTKASDAPAPSASAEAASTSSPEPSPSATSAATPSVPEITPISVNVNCRSGDDVAYSAISVLMFGDSTQVAGRNEDSSWWYVHDPSNPGAFCWISADVVTFSGPQTGIPLVSPPAPIVSGVTVDVELPSTVHCGEPNTVTFSGTITTTGSVKAKYQWEVTGDKEDTTLPQTINFLNAGTKEVVDPGAYSADCGSYKITLHVLSPNDISATKKFKIAGP